MRTGEASEHICDLVVCATGFANAGRPHVPELAGRASSRVEVLHSSELSQTAVDDIVANDRKVVVLSGAGKSAHEIPCRLLLRDRVAKLTWVYVKSLWSMSYEMLYGSPLNAVFYLYYLKLAALRRRLGFGIVMKALQTPLRWSGLLVNPLEPHSDVCRNRVAIMKADQLAFLRQVRSIKAGVVRLGDRSVVLDRGDELEADYLICATGYDRSIGLPALAIEAADGTRSTAACAGRSARLLPPDDRPRRPRGVGALAANVLYPQQVLGYSLGAQWLARFHQGRLAVQPTLAEMTRSMQANAAEFAPWCAPDYLSGGLPYAHQRNDGDVLPAAVHPAGLDRGAGEVAGHRAARTSGSSPRCATSLRGN